MIHGWPWLLWTSYVPGPDAPSHWTSKAGGSSRLCAYLSPRIEGAELVPVQEQADQTQPIRKRISRQCQANTSPDWQFEIFEESTPPYRDGGLIFSRDS